MKHPGKTAVQQRILDEIGCGNNSPFMAPATRNVLLRDGLIVELPGLIVGRDRFSDIVIPQYEMPIPVHYQWCKAMGAEEEA